MKAKRRVLFRRALTRENEYIDVEIGYELGGSNYFTGGSTPRGYYLSVQPVKELQPGMTSFIAFTGTKTILERAERFSAKRLEELAQEETVPGPSIRVRALCRHVLGHQGLELAEPLGEPPGGTTPEEETETT